MREINKNESASIHARRKPLRSYIYLKRCAEWMTIITTLIAVWVELFKLPSPWWLQQVEWIHYTLVIVVELVLWAIVDVVASLAESIQHGILMQLKVIEPHLGIVTRQTHRELYEFSADILSLSGAIVTAIGQGLIDYNDQIFLGLLRGDRRFYSEFIYYWVVESVISLKAGDVISLDMMHYLPANGIYDAFIRRFQQVQRRIPPLTPIRKIYRFRGEQYYDPRVYIPGGKQLLWSQLLMEEYGRAQVVVDYGSDRATRNGPILQEVICVKFRPESRSSTIVELIAVADKDRISFEFLRGRIQLLRR